MEQSREPASDGGRDAAVTQRVDAAAPGLEPAAFAIIFGNSLPEPAVLAAALYHRKLCPLIVTTGGPRSTPPHLVEAEHHWGLLRESGVPPEAILVERASRSTDANAQRARQALLPRLAEPRTAIAVLLWYHRRALASLYRHFPTLERVYSVTYEPVIAGEAITRAAWANTASANAIRLEQNRLDDVDAATLACVTRDGRGWHFRRVP